MKKQIILIFALLNIAFPSFAGTKEDLAKEIIQLSNMQKIIDQMVVQIQQLQDAQLKSLHIPKEKQDKLVEFRNKLMKKIFDSISWDKMAPEYIKLYSEVYTEEELKAIIEFYKSPAGQSMLKKQPIVMQKAMILASEQVQQVMPEIKKTIQEFAQSLKAECSESAEGKKQHDIMTHPPLTTARIISRDGRFIAYDNGIVLDMETGLMWASKDNGYNVDWSEAKSYCENYRGGGYTDWRMPTQDELAGLYDSGNPKYQACYPSQKIYLTNLIDLSCCCPWASDTSGSEAAGFNFSYGSRYWLRQSNDSYQALPVRSVK